MKGLRRVIVVLTACLVGAGAASAQSQETVIYYHTDAIGSVRMITDENGQVVGRYDYLPFGQPCGIACGPQSPPDARQFAGKEKDPESGFDYFGARYYASQTGRFTTVDPLLDLEAAIVDPQLWNRYAYARNNPLLFVDPQGAAIELIGETEDERQTALDAICAGVGQRACGYLYQNKIGNRYFVGIYTNGPDGQGPAFRDLNPIASAFSGVIEDTRIVQLAMLSAGRVVGLGNRRSEIGPMPLASPGVTVSDGSSSSIYLMHPRSGSVGAFGAAQMSNGQPSIPDHGLILTHEIGHLMYYWRGPLGWLMDTSNDSAMRLENALRRLRNPQEPIRILHDRPGPPVF